MIYSNDLFEVFSMDKMGKIYPWSKWVIWNKLLKIYRTLYHMIHSKDICKMLNITFKYSNNFLRKIGPT